MEQYIDKASIVAEIKRRLSLLEGGTGHPETLKRVEGVIKGYKSILSFLDSLEVKEVDLESEERMKECPFRQVCCTMYEGKVLECGGACSWVVDYPKLKELKAKQKEE